MAEAMAIGLPLILSDLPVLREVTVDQAFFVDITDPASFASLMKSFLTGTTNINKYVQHNQMAAKEKYSQEVYLNALLKIYQTALLSTKKQQRPSANDSVN